jgi:hypothetical protein
MFLNQFDAAHFQFTILFLPTFFFTVFETWSCVFFVEFEEVFEAGEFGREGLGR